MADEDVIASVSLDLSGPQGNVYAVLGNVQDALKNHTEGDARMAAINQWMQDNKGSTKGYLELLLYIHENHCTIVDLSGTHEFDDPLFDPVSD
jgi:hypothetical protein